MVSLCLKKTNGVLFNRMPPSDLADHPWYRYGVSDAANGRTHTMKIDTFERCGESIRVTLAANLAIGHDIEPDRFLIAHCQTYSVFLCLF